MEITLRASSNSFDYNNCGTSIQKIDETYGHIEVEKQVDILTQNQGIMRSADIDLSTEILD